MVFCIITILVHDVITIHTLLHSLCDVRGAGVDECRNEVYWSV